MILFVINKIVPDSKQVFEVYEETREYPATVEGARQLAIDTNKDDAWLQAFIVKNNLN